jgi:hypothetical protein
VVPTLPETAVPGTGSRHSQSEEEEEERALLAMAPEPRGIATAEAESSDGAGMSAGHDVPKVLQPPSVESVESEHAQAAIPPVAAQPNHLLPLLSEPEEGQEGAALLLHLRVAQAEAALTAAQAKSAQEQTVQSFAQRIADMEAAAAARRLEVGAVLDCTTCMHATAHPFIQLSSGACRSSVSRAHVGIVSRHSFNG